MIDFLFTTWQLLPDLPLLPIVGATVVLGVVGSAILPGVGTFIGAALGSLIDQYILFPLLFPPDDIKGPRIGELRVQGADEGFPMNICLGEATRVAGEIIWMSNLIEIKDTDEEGFLLNKQKVTTYRYFAHLDIDVCDNQIESIDKIWANGKLVYTKQPELEIITVEASNISVTVDYDVSTSFGGTELTFPALVADIEGTVLPGASTAIIKNATRSPQNNETFTVAADSNTYALTIAPVSLGGNRYSISFGPPAQTQWDDGDAVSFTANALVRRYMVLTSTDPLNDFTRFSKGLVEISGFAKSVNNGTFLVVKAEKSGGTTKLTVVNPSAVAESAGALVTVLQQPSDTSPGIATSITIYTGTETQMSNSLVESIEGVGAVPSYRGHAHVVFEMFALKDFGDSIPNFEFLVRERTGRTVGQAIEIICMRGGLSKGEIKVTGLDEVLNGYPFKGPAPTAQILQPLMITFDLVSQEIDGVLTFTKRANAPKRTLTTEEFGAYSDGKDRPQEFDVQDVQEEDLPSIVHVKYPDPSRDYQAGDQSARKNVFSVEAPLVIELPITLVGSQARAIAERVLWQLYASRHKIKLQLPPSLSTVREYDTLQVIGMDGRVWNPMVEKVDRGADWLVEVQAMEEVIEVSTQTGIADAQAGFPGRDDTGALDPDFNDLTPSAGTPDLQIIDIAPLTAGDETTLGMYAAACMFDPANSWNGAVIYESQDGGASYGALFQLEVEAIIGRTKTTLASTGADQFHWDKKNTVQVEVEEGALVSKTKDQVMAGQNRAVLGNEVIGYMTATLVSGRTYTLSNLIRGLRNTESAITGHVVGERFILLDGLTGVEFLPLTAAQVGSSRVYKAVPDQGDLSIGYPTITHTPRGNTMRCWSPYWVRGQRDSSNNLTIRWSYRSRAVAKLFGPAAAPQLEPSEKYEIDVYNAAGTAVVRTISVEAATTTTYSAANQTTDGLTPGNPITIEVFQISAVLGRGRPYRITV